MYVCIGGWMHMCGTRDIKVIVETVTLVRSWDEAVWISHSACFPLGKVGIQQFPFRV